MAGFHSVYKSNPGLATITEIEGTVIIEEAPPAINAGAGTGRVMLVAEFEDGPFVPYLVQGDSDLEDTFGALGFTYADGVRHRGPVAVQSGGAELWNGNGYIWLAGRRFSSLVISRVDNSAGSVQFQRLASLFGGAGPYSASDGDTVTWTLDGTTTATMTVNGAQAELDGDTGGGIGTTGFVGGEWLGVRTRIGGDVRRVVFTAADQSRDQCRDRINAVLTQTIAADNGADDLTLLSEVAGGDGYIEVVEGTARATLGFPLAPVAQVHTYTVEAVDAGAQDYTIGISLLIDGQVVQYPVTVSMAGGETTEELRDALLLEWIDVAPPGVSVAPADNANPAYFDIVVTADANVAMTPLAIVAPGTGVITEAVTEAGTFTAAYGTGNVGDLSAITRTEAVVLADAVANITAASSNGMFRVTNALTPGVGTLQTTGGSGYSNFGFDLSTIASAADGTELPPAGTRVQDSTATATVWVTMETAVLDEATGVISARVRPFTDDDTALSSSANDVTVLVDADALDEAWSVDNALGLTRLTAQQIDNRYLEALTRSLDENGKGADVNIVCSARSSATIMTALGENARAATRQGLDGRVAIARPPVGTSIQVMSGDSGVGVGAMRSEHLCYVGVGEVARVAALADGPSGATGFNADGLVTRGADGSYAMMRSLIAPEESARVDPATTNVERLPAIRLDPAFDAEYGGVTLERATYINFKASGIIALRRDPRLGRFHFQSDVTSVNPSVNLALAPARMRFFRNFLQDTIAEIALPYTGQMATGARVSALRTGLERFLDLLLSPNQPELQRIIRYSVEQVVEPRLARLNIVYHRVSVELPPTMDNPTFAVALDVGVGDGTLTFEAA